jgi:hypothetical protein
MKSNVVLAAKPRAGIAEAHRAKPPRPDVLGHVARRRSIYGRPRVAQAGSVVARGRRRAAYRLTPGFFETLRLPRKPCYNKGCECGDAGHTVTLGVAKHSVLR